MAQLNDLLVMGQSTLLGPVNANGTITASQFNGPLNGGIQSTGYGNGTLTYFQTSEDFNNSSGWNHYIIANHGSGRDYYNYMIALPFWDPPKYRRKTGGNAGDNLSEWYDFVTDENLSSKCITATLSGTNNTTLTLNIP